ncbi:hypothetical protein ETR_12373 [Erwinia tracheiphila PSU-1]|nr:hypothetical protein ETR_12373 [Erwinia tracheiphila PSU-1]
MEIQTHGGRATGWHPKLPIVYPVPSLSGSVWPVVEVAEKYGGVLKTTLTSNIDGCTVIWR